MTDADAITYLNTLGRNAVREAATFYFDAAGADWDGEAISLLRDGTWHRYSGPSALPCGLARHLKLNPVQ